MTVPTPPLSTTHVVGDPNHTPEHNALNTFLNNHPTSADHDVRYLRTANNLSDVSVVATARTNLGLGSAATANKVAAGSVGVLDATDPSLTNARTPSGAAGGGLSGTYPNPTVVTVAAGAAGPLSATDPSVTNARTPTGAAGGGLSGTYPNPSVVTVAAGAAGPLSATDPSTTNARTPTGAAGGDLTGTYPNPSVPGKMSVINVKDAAYGALGNGVANDATAIQNAINAAVAAGGPTIVYIPAGTYIIGSQLTLPSNVTLRGAGRSLTILQAANALNATVIRTTNFAALNGTNPTSNFGTSEFAVENLTIDGNRTNQLQTGFYGGLEIYGYDYRINNVEIRNVQGRGFYSEWTNNSTASTVNSMEANITHLKCHNNQYHGFHFNGPHDTLCDDVISFLNDPNSTGIYLDTKANGVQLTNCHSWGTNHAYAIQAMASGIQIYNTQAEGAGLAQVWIQANDVQFNGFAYGPSAGNSSVGIKLGASGATVTRWRVNANIGSCNGGAIDFTYDGGYGTFQVVNYGITGSTVLAGTPAASSGGLLVPQGQPYRSSNSPTMIGAWNADSWNVRGNLTVSGGQLIATAPSATFVPVIGKGVAGQSADLLQAQNAAGTAVAKVDFGGALSGSGLTVTGQTRFQNMAAPVPTVTVTGTAGTTSYTYYVVARDSQGAAMASNAVTVTTGNATLSATNYNAISWALVPGATSYDVLKTNTSTSIATGVTAGPVNDTGQATAAYTLAAATPTIIAKAVAGQATDLFKGQDSNSNDLVRFLGNGYMLSQGIASGPGAYSNSGYNTLTCASPGSGVLGIQGVTGQTGSLTTWFTPTGSVLTRIDSAGRLIVPSASAVTLTVPTGAPAAVSGQSNDMRGVVTFGSGTTPAAGTQVTVSFSQAFNGTPGAIVLTAQNSATQALGLYVSASSSTSFTVSSAAAPAASQTNTTYAFSYMVLG